MKKFMRLHLMLVEALVPGKYRLLEAYPLSFSISGICTDRSTVDPCTYFGVGLSSYIGATASSHSAFIYSKLLLCRNLNLSSKNHLQLPLGC